MKTTEIKFTDLRKPPSLKFPRGCVNCGREARNTLAVRLPTGAQARGREVQVELDVPLCASCRTLEDRIGNVTWIPFALAGLLIGLAVFVPVLLVAPQGDSIQTMDMPWVLAGSAALGAGVAGGTLVEFVLRLAFKPVFGSSLTRRPLTVLEVLNDSQHLVGFSARLNRAEKRLVVTIENDRVAGEFVSMNRGSIHEV
jgi:hypothetical protein